MIRRTLDGLYSAAGYAAALFLVGIGVTIIVQVVARWMSVTVDSTEAAGLCLAASTFFGLAHTFRKGSHVRITLLVRLLPRGPKRIFEILNCLIAGATISFLAWHVIALTMQSYEYHDVSPGLLAMPFWIPQLGVSIGVTLFAVAILDDLVTILLGRVPSYAVDEHPEDTHAD
ncbi:TRAP transporter small permease [Stappia sp.]|jgi:TRAP-type C4-dicarboxylate transport system permease small subunit|uniref:TRAP transporter small permease n=1 Tax=Stappia sp. TaxID=1870903 RepID=UPI003A98D5A6